ncbi:MAG: hypothetical protein AB8E15_01135 [Bdellovibrionales bacterium]
MKNILLALSALLIGGAAHSIDIEPGKYYIDGDSTYYPQNNIYDREKNEHYYFKSHEEVLERISPKIGIARIGDTYGISPVNPNQHGHKLNFALTLGSKSKSQMAYDMIRFYQKMNPQHNILNSIKRVYVTNVVSSDDRLSYQGVIDFEFNSVFGKGKLSLVSDFWFEKSDSCSIVSSIRPEGNQDYDEKVFTPSACYVYHQWMNTRVLSMTTPADAIIKNSGSSLVGKSLEAIKTMVGFSTDIFVQLTYGIAYQKDYLFRLD